MSSTTVVGACLIDCALTSSMPALLQFFILSISSFASFITDAILLGANLLFPLLTRLALAPFGLWPKLSPKTFANHLSLKKKLL